MIQYRDRENQFFKRLSAPKLPKHATLGMIQMLSLINKCNQVKKVA